MGRKGRKPITKIGGFNILMLVVATLLAGFVIFLWTVVGLTKEQWDDDGHHYKTVYTCSDEDTCDKEEHVHTPACYVKDEPVEDEPVEDEPAVASEVDEADDPELVEDTEDVVDVKPVDPPICETEAHTHTMISRRVYYGPDWTKHFLDRYEGLQVEGIFNNLNLMQFTTLLTVVDFVLLLVFISIIVSRAKYLKRHKHSRPGIKRGDHFGGRQNPPAPPVKKKTGKKDSKNPEPPPPTVHNGQIRRRR